MLIHFIHFLFWSLATLPTAFLPTLSPHVAQLTDNLFNDERPLISNNNIFWQQADGVIICYDINRAYAHELIQIPESSYFSIDAETMIWQQRENNQDFIYFASTENAGLYRIAAGGNLIQNPQIKRQMLAWCVNHDAGYILCLLNLKNHKIRRIHLNQPDKPAICLGSRFLAYSAIDEDQHQVKIMDIRNGSIKTISNPGFLNGKPFCQGMRVSWEAYDGHDYEIFCYDDYTGFTYRVTDNEFDDLNPRLSNNMLCWMQTNEHENNIALMQFDNMTTSILKPNKLKGKYFTMDDDFVVWVNESGNNKRLQIYDITAQSYHQLAHYDCSNAQPYLLNHLIVWQGFDGTDDEIFCCRLDTISN